MFTYLNDGFILRFNSTTYYYKYNLYGNAYFHREDGPAVEYYNGSIAYYLNGKLYHPLSNDEWIKFVKYKWML